MIDNGKGKSALGSMIVGAAIGAAAATLMNKSSRKKVKDTLKNVLDKGDAKLDEIGEKALNLKKSVKVKAVRELNKTQKKLA